MSYKLCMFLWTALFVTTSRQFDKLLEPPHCGKSTLVTKRVVGGTLANKTSDFPWMALIGHKPPNGSVWCDGSLITSRHVLTAAHCLHTDLGIPTNVHLGDLNWVTNKDGTEGEDFKVKDVFEHKEYSKIHDVSANDVAILVLEEDVTFKESIQPICLLPASERNNQFLGFMPYIAGWGSAKANSSYHGLVSHLRYAQLEVMPDEKCSMAYRDKYNGTSNMCAGDPLAMKDACAGDSGGPLMKPRKIKVNGRKNSYMYQIGVVSYGPTQCATTGKPSVYARLTHFMPWIEEQIAK